MIILNPLELANVAIGAFGAMQKLPELAAMIDLVDSGNPERILEIGVGKGGTSWCWSKIQSVKQIIGIDLPGGPFGGGPTQASLEHIAGNTKARYDYIAGNSQNSEAKESVQKLLEGALVDVLYIDGNHTYEGVKTDFLEYKEFVRQGGLIIFHDICKHDPLTGCEVERFWLEVKPTLAEDGYCEFISEPTTWGGIGIMKVV